MKITLVTIGKTKSAACKELVDYYVKLSGRFQTTEHVELPVSERRPQDEALERYLGGLKAQKLTLVILDEKGVQFTSRELSQWVEKSLDQGTGHLVFAVAAAHGFGENIKSKAKLVWSLSKQTLAHELAAAVVAEQVYRGLSIMNKHPYHND